MTIKEIAEKALEEFKNIPGYEGLYQISRSGVVRSFFRRNGPTIKKQSDHGGYKKVPLCKNGKVRMLYIHRLLLLTFIKSPKKGQQCAHLDGNPKNNSLENLKWCSVSENHSHKKIHGTLPKGEAHHLSKLKEKDIPKIFSLRKKGESLRAIAKKFNVNNYTIYKVLSRKNWSHVSLKSNANKIRE